EDVLAQIGTADAVGGKTRQAAGEFGTLIAEFMLEASEGIRAETGGRIVGHDAHAHTQAAGVVLLRVYIESTKTVFAISILLGVGELQADVRQDAITATLQLLTNFAPQSDGASIV